MNATLEQVRTLGPSIAARGEEIERCGTLPRDLVEELLATQAFRQFVPSELDGPGATAWQCLEVIEELAYHDGSTGWCVAIACTGSLLASFLGEPWAERIFADRRSITGGFAQPVGRAIAVDGGLRVSGRWQWGSGTRHCTWIGGGCRLVGPDGRPAPRADGLTFPFVFFEPDDVHLFDNWQVSGLCGTGSVDYSVDAAFVPEGRWVQLAIDPPRLDTTVSRFSFFGLLALCIAATSVGIARRAIDELITLAADKRPQGSSRSLRERSSIQADTAIAEAELRSMWLFVRDTVEDAWRTALAGEPQGDEQRRSLRLSATHATQTAAGITERMYKAAGGAAVYRSSPLQRCFRDAFVATQHAMIAGGTSESGGGMRLGLDTDTRML